MAKDKVKIPRALKGRMKDVAKNHKFESADALAIHFVDRGLKVYKAPEEGSLADRLSAVVDDQGYSSEDELLEHLLLRGLKAYEEVDEDPAALEARLRGLGYID